MLGGWCRVGGPTNGVTKPTSGSSTVSRMALSLTTGAWASLTPSAPCGKNTLGDEEHAKPLHTEHAHVAVAAADVQIEVTCGSQHRGGRAPASANTQIRWRPGSCRGHALVVWLCADPLLRSVSLAQVCHETNSRRSTDVLFVCCDTDKVRGVGEAVGCLCAT